MSNRLFSDVFYKMLEEYDDGWFSKNCVEDIVIPIDDDVSLVTLEVKKGFDIKLQETKMVNVQ